MPETRNPDAPSTFAYEVLFEGLVSLVPLKKPEGPQAQGVLFALPRLLRGGPSDPRLPRAIPPHVACVVVESERVAAGEEADLEFRLPGEPRKSIYAFRNEKLTLEHGGPSVLSADRSTLAPGVTSPDDAGAPGSTDLAWVPSLRGTQVTGADVFDRGLLAPNLAPGSGHGRNRVAGTFVPASGTLSTVGVVRYEEGQHAGSPVVFEFREDRGAGKTRFSQAMFDRMKLTGTAPGPSLRLDFADEYDVKRSVELRPDARGRLELAIVNLELEEVVRFGEGFPRAVSPTDADPDFATGYWLSHAWDTVQARDVVVPHAAGQGPGGSGPPCRSPAYEGLEPWP